MSSRSSSVALVFASYRSMPHFSLRSPHFHLPRPVSLLRPAHRKVTDGDCAVSRKRQHQTASYCICCHHLAVDPSGARTNAGRSRHLADSRCRPVEQLELDSATAARERSWPMLHGNTLVPSRFQLVTLRHVESPSDGKHVPTREGELFKFKNNLNLMLIVR